MKILILGASGMIGHAIFDLCNRVDQWHTIGTYNTEKNSPFLKKNNIINLSLNYKSKQNILINKIKQINPDVIINCVGIIKQKQFEEDIRNIIFLNSLLPHDLVELGKKLNFRLIHISTDCIFSGLEGNYTELMSSDAKDVYGKTKYLGEVVDKKNLTIRTSTIGHEIASHHGLLEWFLSQKKSCEGYANAYFSGLTNIELAKIIRDVIIPNNNISGLYNVGGKKIDKYSLLILISKIYKKNIAINKNITFKIDRSISSKNFCKNFNYKIKSWTNLIEEMYLRHDVI